MYGPFTRDGKHTSEGNATFHASLQQRDPRWGEWWQGWRKIGAHMVGRHRGGTAVFNAGLGRVGCWIPRDGGRGSRG